MANPNRNPADLSLDSVQNKIKNMVISNGTPVVLETTYPLSEFVCGTPPESSTAMHVFDLTNYDNRLKTFRDSNWTLDFIAPCEMARAGFYYKGRSDTVKCIFCSIELSYWKRGDNPLVEHKLKSPQCQFIKEQDCDVNSMHDSPLVEDYLDEWIENLDYLGIVEKSNNTPLKIFSKLEARIKSFEKCNIHLKPDLLALCEAGFFYAGQDDHTICFYCLKGLQNWECGDDPWKLHAIWSPLCSHVLLCKGIQFVEEACGVESGGLKTYLEKMNLTEILASRQNRVGEVDRNSGSPESTKSSTTASPKFVTPERTEPKMTFLCKICLNQQMNVVFIPCGHIFACLECSALLDLCPVCRLPKSNYKLVKIEIEEKNNVGDVACASLEQCSVEPTDSTQCIVCYQEEIRTAIVPCMHVYACFKCAMKNSTCKICSEKILGVITVYL